MGVACAYQVMFTLLVKRSSGVWILKNLTEHNERLRALHHTVRVGKGCRDP